MIFTSMPSTRSIIAAAAAACLASVVSAAPASLFPTTHLVAARQSSSSCTAPGQITRPVMYNLYPNSPNKSEPATTYINLQNLPDREEREQVVVFTGIPADAKVCTLGWIQAKAEERNFTVQDNGSTKVKPFYKFPEAPDCGGTDGEAGDEEPEINYAVIEPLASASDESGLTPDFTFWDQAAGNTTHTAGAVTCAENMYFLVQINTINGNGSVLFEQDEKNGWVMRYTC